MGRFFFQQMEEFPPSLRDSKLKHHIHGPFCPTVQPIEYLKKYHATHKKDIRKLVYIGFLKSFKHEYGKYYLLNPKFMKKIVKERLIKTVCAMTWYKLIRTI